MAIDCSKEFTSMSYVTLVLMCALVTVPQGEPGIGSSIVSHDIRVTLLDARRLSFEEYRDARQPESAPWKGGGFRFAFLAENRPGAPLPPGLGEVRVLIGSKLYNDVTNAISSKPFAPLIIIRATSDFFETAYGATLKARAPASRAGATAVVLEVFIPGPPIPAGTSGVVDLEQAETHRPDAQGRMRPLEPAEMARTWTSFRFSFPPLD